MKKLFLHCALLVSLSIQSQQQTQNIIIITTDGFRWQDLFQGMDSSLANDSRYNQGDSAYIYKNYWHNDEKERRKLLLPFMWSTMVEKGQIFGNRSAGCKVDN